jgi:ATP-dependent DNA helicase RecG
MKKPRIRIFLDRIELMNPGPLPKDFASIMKGDFTMPRNPIIARVFRAIKLSENAGSGFDKMFSG